MERSFSQVLIVIISFIYLFFGIFHLILPKQIGLFVMHGADGQIATLLQQFLGASYLLIGVLLYLLRRGKGNSLYITIGVINIIAFIHLYLIFLFNNIIHLSLVYFVFIVLVQICFFIALIEQVQKR